MSSGTDYYPQLSPVIRIPPSRVHWRVERRRVILWRSEIAMFIEPRQSIGGTPVSRALDRVEQGENIAAISGPDTYQLPKAPTVTELPQRSLL